MRLAIDFHYGISYVPYRHQNSQKATGAASTEVEIVEVVGDAAPVVMRVGNRADLRKSERFKVREDGSLREVRMHDGRYWVEVGPASGIRDQVGPGLNTSPFGKLKPWVDHDPNPEKRDHRAPTTAAEIQRLQYQPLRSINDDGGEDMSRRLAERAGMLLIVDGTLFEETAEPVLSKCAYEREAIIRPRPAPSGTIDHFRLYEIYASTTFRESTSYEALSTADSLQSSIKHRYDGEIELGCDFEVVDRTASTFDGTAHDVSMFANSIMTTMRAQAPYLTRDGLVAMYGLRDALREAMGTATPRLIDALETIERLTPPEMNERRGVALRKAGKATKNAYYHHQKSFEGELGKDDAAKAIEASVAMAKQALARWEVRPTDRAWEAGCVVPSSFRDERSWSRQLLSVGQIKDACAAVGIDAGPVVAAAMRGAKVMALGAGSAGASALAVVTPDGRSHVLGKGAAGDEYGPTLERHLMAAERGVEAVFDLLPIASPSR